MEEEEVQPGERGVGRKRSFLRNVPQGSRKEVIPSVPCPHPCSLHSSPLSRVCRCKVPGLSLQKETPSYSLHGSWNLFSAASEGLLLVCFQ